MAALPPASPLLGQTSIEQSVQFNSFETSIARLERTRWNLAQAIQWETLDEDGAIDFIKYEPQRDKRQLFYKHRFRFLYTQYHDMARLYKQTALIETAAKHGWICEQFKFFIEKNTTGSASLHTSDGLGFIAQAPTDDIFPFFSFSLTSKYKGHERNADWLCLLFAGPDLRLKDLEEVLCRYPFPSDYEPPLSPDFMFLPVSLLRWQVEQFASQLMAIKREIISQDELLLSRNTDDFGNTRANMFMMRKKHLMLHRRCLFAQEVAGNLNRYFDTIEKHSTSSQGVPVKYSPTLRGNVQTHEAVLDILLRDLETTLLRIEAQQTMVDNHITIRIAKSSEMAAEEARRDSTSMRTIAVMTLVFLPGTFVAAIFSMSMFNWQANEADGGNIASKYTWLYFVITAPLTLIVLLAWILWFRWSDTTYRKKWVEKII